MFTNSLYAQNQNKMFSHFIGQWELNPTQSEFYDLDPRTASPVTIFINEMENKIILTRFFNSQSPKTDSLAISGAPFSNKDGESGSISSSRLVELKEKDFTVQTSYSSKASEKLDEDLRDIQRTEGYSLLKGDKVLILTRNVRQPDGKTVVVKAVFEYLMPLMDLKLDINQSKPTAGMEGKYRINKGLSFAGHDFIQEYIEIKQNEGIVIIEAANTVGPYPPLSLKNDGSKLFMKPNILGQTYSYRVQWTDEGKLILYKEDGSSITARTVYELSKDRNTLIVHALNIKKVAYLNLGVYNKVD